MAERNYEQEFDAVKNDLSALRADLKSLMASLGTNARDSLGDAYQSARQFGSEKVQVAEDQITKNPLASVAVAFGVGLLVGRLLNGK